MQEEIKIGTYLVQDVADSEPRVVVVVGVLTRVDGVAYEVKAPGSKRAPKEAAPSTLRRIGLSLS